MAQLMGRTAIDSDGDKLGTIEQVYLNDASAHHKTAEHAKSATDDVSDQLKR